MTRVGIWRDMRGTLAALALTALCSGASAETLKEVLTKTYNTNPDLAAERAHVREVDEGVSQAHAKWRPTLSLEAEYERQSSSISYDFGKFDARSATWSAEVVARQPLFTGGRNANHLRLAMARVRAARARLRMKEQSVLLDAATTYVNAARNEIVLDLVREDISLLQELLREVGARRDAKRATDSDVDQTTAALEAARAQCLSDFAAMQDSWRAYEQVVGEPPPVISPAGDQPQVNPCIDPRGDRVHSTLDLPVDLAATPGSADAVERAAQGNVPELDEARAEEEASSAKVRAAYAELLPSAALTASFGAGGESFDPQWEDREATVGAELVVPIFNTGAEWSEIRAAREAANRARLNIASRQRQVMRDALHAWYDLVSIRAVRSINKAQAKTLLKAFEGLRAEMNDPKLHRSNTDLLTLRQAYLGARTQLINSQRDEATAIYRLMASTGHLNATFLELPVTAYDPAANLKAQEHRLIGDKIHGE
jgi:outer membrane protein